MMNTKEPLVGHQGLTNVVVAVGCSIEIQHQVLWLYRLPDLAEKRSYEYEPGVL